MSQEDKNKQRRGKRPEGYQDFFGTLPDVANVTANIVDDVNFDRKTVALRGLEAGPGIILTVEDADDNTYTTGDKKIVITSTAGAGGEPNDGVNLGTGEGIFTNKFGFNLQFKSFKSGPSGAMSITSDGDHIILDVPGAVGPIGPAGASGATGPAGGDGPVGAIGPAGVGIPIGGTAGQHLAKIDGADYNTEWVNPATGGGSPAPATSWLALTDTPITYTGQQTKILQVNGTEDALIFVDMPTSFSGDYNDLTNKPFIPVNFSDLSGQVTELMLDVPTRNKLNDTIPSNLTAGSAPSVLNDASDGWQVGSFWVDVTNNESYRLIDDTIGTALWVKTTLSTDELAAVAVSGDYNHLSNTPIVADTFLELTDTNGSYVGHSGQTVVVNATETGLEFGTIPGSGIGHTTASNLGIVGEGVYSTQVADDLRFKRIIAGANVALIADANTITINASGPDGGEDNTASNLGTGEGQLFASKSIVDLQFRSLKAGNNVAITQSGTEITIESFDTGENNTVTNVGGSGVGLFKQKTGIDLEFKRIVAGAGISIVNNADTIELSSSGGGSGETNTASNLGAGEGIFGIKTGTDLGFKSIIAGSNVTLSSDANTITVSAVGPDGGENNTASNLGVAGVGLFAQKIGSDLQFKRLVAGANVSFVNGTNDIEISAVGSTGEVNTGSSLGAGENIFAGKVINDLQFKSIIAGANVTLVSDVNTITVSAVGPDGGENNTASNLGVAGVGLFAQKIGSDLQFKRLVAGTGVSFVNGANDIEISSSTGITNFITLNDTPSNYVGGANKVLIVNGTETGIIYGNAGEDNTGSSLGTGVGIFAQKSGVDLQFKSFVAGAGVALTSNANEITITSTATGAGEANTASNLGAGEGTIFATKSGSDLQLRSIKAGTNVTITQSGTEITIDATDAVGENNTASNVTTPGLGLFKQKTGIDLEFKRVVAGANVTLTDGVDSIEVSAATGATTFTELNDSPVNYAGQTGKSLIVNGTEDGIIFADAGEDNIAANIGATGEGIFAQKSGVELQFKKLIAGTNVTLTADANSITVDAPDTGEVNTASNLGAGSNVFSGKLVNDLQFKSIVGGTNLTISETSTEITIDATDTGEANTASNITTPGLGWFKQKTGNDLEFKRVTAGIGVTITNSVDSIEIAAPNVSGQNLFETITADTGNTTANSPTDTFNVIGGTGINTAIVGDTITITNTVSATSGEANTASNLGINGEGLFVSKVAADLQFKEIIGGTNITLTPSATGITINAALVNNLNDITDVDTTTIAPTINDHLEWNGALWVPATPAAAVSSTGVNLGTGEGVFFQAISSALEFKSLKAGAGILLSSNANEITITADSLAGIQHNLNATVAPTVTDDASSGYAIGSLWIDITNNESYRLVDSTTGAGIWLNTTLTADELASVAISGDYNDLINQPIIPAPQNLWDTVTADTGSTSANVPADTLTVAGGPGITTSIVGDSLIITSSAGSQNLWETMAADTGLAAATTTTDTFTIAGGTNITTSIVGNVLTINTTPGQNVFETLTGDTGTRTANTTTETFNIVGGTNVTTTVVGSTLTIDATAGASTQNVFQTIVASVSTGSASGLPIIAESISDTFTIIAGNNVTLTTNPTNDSIEIDVNVPTAQNDFGTISLSSAGGGNTTGDTNIVAETTSDTLTLNAGTGITLDGNATTDVVTITSNGAPDQNVFTTVTANTGNTTANTTTDTLNIIGGTNVTTTIVGDTLTIDSSVGGSAATTARIRIVYNSSGNISSIDASTVPAGWTVINTSNDVSITYTETNPPISITYAGMNLSTGTYKYRQPTSANEAQFAATAFGTSGTTMTLNVPFSAMGGNAAAPPFSADGYIILRF